MTRPTARYVCATLLTVTLGLAAAVGLSPVLRPALARTDDPAGAIPPPRSQDASHNLLNALLASALDANAVPLRWVDPRAALQCGPNTAVLVNREPLRNGALVPDTLNNPNPATIKSSKNRLPISFLTFESLIICPPNSCNSIQFQQVRTLGVKGTRKGWNPATKFYYCLS